jgi:hypothetical protein
VAARRDRARGRPGRRQVRRTEAPGPDAVIRGLSLTSTDDEVLRVSGPIFDGLYDYHRRALLHGREPA